MLPVYSVQLLQFSTSWCGHCVKMAPEWAALAATIHKDYRGLKVVSVGPQRPPALRSACLAVTDARRRLRAVPRHRPRLRRGGLPHHHPPQAPKDPRGHQLRPGTNGKRRGARVGGRGDASCQRRPGCCLLRSTQSGHPAGLEPRRFSLRALARGWAGIRHTPQRAAAAHAVVVRGGWRIAAAGQVKYQQERERGAMLAFIRQQASRAAPGPAAGRQRTFSLECRATPRPRRAAPRRRLGGGRAAPAAAIRSGGAA